MADIVRAGVLWGYCQLTQTLGADPVALLGEVGIARSDLDDHDQYVARPAVVELFELTAQRLHCADFGLRLADFQDIYILGALAFAIRNAPDLKSAIDSACRYIRYHSPASTMTLEASDRGGEVRVVLDLSPAEETAMQMIEHSLGMFCDVMKQLTGGEARPTRVMFAHRPLSSVDVYNRHLGLIPEFERECDSVGIARRDLGIPINASDRPLQAIIKRYLDLNSPDVGELVEQRVHHALARLMRSDSHARMDDVADLLRVHPRTLQRNLRSANTTFERVRDEVRRELAEIYLAHGEIPIPDVADLLGYASQSVLTRSCMRWFGITPLAVRQQALRQVNARQQAERRKSESQPI